MKIFALRPTLVAIVVAVMMAMLLHIGIGSSAMISPVSVLREVLHGPHNGESAIGDIVWYDRLPRAIGCVLIGALLGIVGSAFQALLRNRLAEPYTIGVSSGAAIGGAIAMVLGLGGAIGGLGMMAFGFITGMLSLALVFALGSRRGAVDTGSLLLAGVVIGSLLSSLLTLVLLGAGRDSNQLMQWLLGKVDTFQWIQLGVLAVILVVGAAILMRQTRLLNAYAIGEDTARRLGVDVRRLRTVVLVVCTAMTSAAVGVAGIIAFVGLVAPHISRRLFGVDWRVSMFGAGAVGAVTLLVADCIAQRGLTMFGLTNVINVPVGAVTAIIGAPSLLILLRSRG